MKGFEGDSEKVREVLGNQEPFDFWIKEASYYSTKFGWHDHSCVEALSIVKNTFGEEWIKGKIAESQKGQPPFLERHPIVGWLLTPGKRQVVSLLELSLYIKALFSYPRFNLVVAMMKNENQFLTCLNQLAFACRFLNIGCENLEFEPPTDGGRNSDIKFYYNGACFILESFVPAPSGKMWYENILKYTSERAMEVARQNEKRVSILLILKCKEDSWSEVLRKQLEAKIRDMIKLVGEYPEIFQTNEFKVSVFNTSKMLDHEEEKHFNEIAKNALCGINLGFMKTEKTLNVMRGEKVEYVKVGRFAIEVYDIGENRAEEILERLSTKMEKKIVQTRKIDENAKGILLVEEPYTGSGSKKAGFERIKNKVVEAHDGIAAALIVTKTHGKNEWPLYSGVLLEKQSSQGAEREMFQKLLELEWSYYK